MLFDGLRRQFDASVAPGATIQWDFSDAEPWHLRIAVGDGPTAVAPGPRRGSRPHLPLPLQDWVDIAAGRTEPWRALLHGKVRPTGRLRMLLRAPKLFG